MVLATRVREAYEYGFRGNKREYVSVARRAVSRNPETMSRRLMIRVSEVSCDMCGVQIADVDNTCPFYFCRRCKKDHSRFELCVSCHALEVLQGEGKYTGEGLHPHFRDCTHHDLERHKSLADAYPHSPHLKRASCDFCGHSVFPGTEHDYIHVCRTCPRDRGYRFEVCEPCACLLREEEFVGVRAQLEKDGKMPAVK